MSRLRTLLFALTLLAPALASAQQAQRVDDSASQVLGGLLRMQWLDPAPVAGASNLVAGQVTVLVNLDVSPWRGRSVRIYQTLDKQALPVRVEWTARGPMLPGAMADGERSLVFAGVPTADQLSDTFVFTIFADGSQLDRPELLDFSFELEVEGQ